MKALLSQSSRIGVAVGAAVVLAGGIGLGACQDTSNGSGGGAGTGAGSANGHHGPGFTPSGCEFSVVARPEYTEFKEADSTVGATPNIRRVRLGLGGNVEPGSKGKADPATSIGVAWQTDDGTLASEIEWGPGPDPTTWPAANRTHGVTWLTPQGTLNGTGDERMHEAYVCGLEADTTYHYRVGGGASGSEVWSDVYAFTTAPKAGAGPVTVAITGDSRGEQNNAWQILQRRVTTMAPTLQLFSGDMINLAPDQGEWEQWLDNAWRDSDKKTPLALGQVLTLAAHGNHDNHTALFFGNLVLPQDNQKYGNYGELFFSVDVGPVHVIVLDDAWIADPSGDANYQAILEGWLTADLDAAKKNRSKVPWIVAMHHHPEYSSSTHGHDGDVLRVRKFLVPIWDKYHVDLSIAGHDHDYERSKPLTGPADTPTIHSSFADGTVYLVCAGSGADGYGASSSTFTEKSHDYQGAALGLYGVLTATSKSLKLEAHELHADGSDPVFDTLSISK